MGENTRKDGGQIKSINGGEWVLIAGEDARRCENGERSDEGVEWLGWGCEGKGGQISGK